MASVVRFIRCTFGLHVPAPRIDPQLSRFWWCTRCGHLVNGTWVKRHAH